jgi:hypothetical protein
MQEKPQIELKDDSIIINNLVVDDINTCKIIKDIAEDKREDFIKKAIIIGAIGLKNLYLAENVDYIEKEFKELLKNSESQSKEIRNNLERDFKELLKNSEIQSKDIKNDLEREFKELLKNSESQSKDIKHMIEKTLDIENNASSLGKMRVLFEDYFDKRKGKISDLLSPFEENSPIKKLKDEIFSKIQELKDEVIKEKSKEEIIEKTSLKGGKFEEIVLEQLEDFCSEYEDKVIAVGENLGKINKVGDITIDIDGDNNKRIVVECKDSCTYSHKKTLDEISEAIKNRDSKFGIFLFKSQSQVPSALAPMKITNNYIVTSFENYGLYFALRVARLFVERSTEDKQKVIPIDEIQRKIEGLREKLLDFKNIQTKLTQIDNASEYIRENIDKLKKDIEEGLSSIKELIK